MIHNEGKLSISLLRSPKYPDPNADIGKHKFTYSVLTHVGTVGLETVREGYILNSAIDVREAAACDGALPEEMSLVRSLTSGFVIETVKEAEDKDGIIIRGYEALGDRENVTVKLAISPSEAHLCGLMEECISPLKIENGEVSFLAKPFEIVTLRIK